MNPVTCAVWSIIACLSCGFIYIFAYVFLKVGRYPLAFVLTLALFAP